MKTIKTDIIPSRSTFVDVESSKELDFEAICIFMASGFFLDTDTYWKNKKVLKPASLHSIDERNHLISTEPYFKWHYTPRNIAFGQALDEFESLFDKIIKEQVSQKKVILPLSGGIDSRTQAVALKDYPQVHTYSYAFKDGYPENLIGKKIAKTLHFKFTPLEVQSGYLWNCIHELAAINQCYSEFTHPRQMAFVNQYKKMGDIFSLGHWGDVLFDSDAIDQLTAEEEVLYIIKKIVKKGGLELASSLWISWDLEGDFETYFRKRIKDLLSKIEIKHSAAKIRAFKSLYWAPRWTSINLDIFESIAPISLPYYDNRMCQFICTIPEEYLKDRRLQIAYIQRKSKKVANITWHEHKPFSLNNYHFNKSPYNIPYRVYNKGIRIIKKYIGKQHISRNWELQFLGIENDEHLRKWLFNSGLDQLVEAAVTKGIYDSFKTKDAVKYSHPVSMLLTLALFNQKFNE